MTTLPSSLDELETPVPIADLDRVDRNLDRMATYAARHGLALRPHTKTHKSSLIGRMQIDRGAIGLTCATPREAEVMSSVSEDLLLAYPAVSPHSARRVAEIGGATRVTVALDSRRAVDEISTAASSAGHRIGIYVEIDLGMHRVGTQDTAEAVALARMIEDSSHLDFSGIAFYPGHIRQHVIEQAADLAMVAERLAATIDEMDRAGVRPPTVSGGSTPTAWHSHEIPGVTEIRPGTYVYNDRTTTMLGACDWDDCALTLLATVVSTSVPGQAVVDAGTKSLGREPIRAGDTSEGFGSLLDRPGVIVKAMSEEHGLLDLSKTDWKPEVGDKVRIIPNHVCVAIHLFDEVIGLREGEITESIPVAARGRRELTSGGGK